MASPSDPSNGQNAPSVRNSRFASSLPTDNPSSNGAQYQRPTLLKTLSNPGKLNSKQRPPFRRAQSIRDKISTETHKFFGVSLVPMTPDVESPPYRIEALNSQFEADQKWQRRRFRHLKNSYGVKSSPVVEQLQRRPVVDSFMEMQQADLSPSPQHYISDPLATRSFRALGDTRQPHSRLERRDSVAKMTYEAVSRFLQGNAFKKTRRRDIGEAPTYTSIRERNQLRGDFSFPKAPAVKSLEAINGVEEDDIDNLILDMTPQPTAYSIRSAESINFSQPQRYRNVGESSTMVDHAGVPPFPIDQKLDQLARVRAPTETSKHTTHTIDQRRAGLRPALIEKERRETGSHGLSLSAFRDFITNPTQVGVEHESKWSVWWQEIFRPRRSRHRNMPFVKYRSQDRMDPLISKVLDDERLDYRPFFTYWITTVQIVICLFSIFFYGIGTDFNNGFDVIERSGDVLASTLSTLHIVVWEQNNIWVGPRYANLVHMGAKYTPCMRADARIFRQINEERLIESTDTGCCIGPDEKCFQTSSCPKQFATFSKSTLRNGRRQPIVCGQDPRFCDSPRLVDWTNNTSKWPKCQQKSYLIPKQERHMHCEISGRPCCIQMHGQCRITTKEYCDFVSGYYHENATLCSQVSCLNDVCGMTPFLLTDTPDQFYRFVLPLFIHAGIIRLIITCLLQLTIMRKFELMIGCVRLALIYFVSGIGGYLASASFVPYMPEVGPAGSQGGILGALIINIVFNWPAISHPVKALLLHLAMALFLFLTGLLPYIDNWAQLFGFIFGILMAAATIPYFEFGKGTRLLIVIASLLITVLLFAFLLVLFYGLPVIDIPVLSMINCVLVDSKVCDQQGLILKSWLPI